MIFLGDSPIAHVEQIVSVRKETSVERGTELCTIW